MPDLPLPPPSRPWLRPVIALIALSLFALGSFLLIQKIRADRRALREYRDRPLNERREAPPSGTQTKTYTGEELEQARKSGRLPAGAATASQAAQPGGPDAQIQRTLKTIEEINRINEMNRRMMEEQQRIQRQQQQR